VLTGEWGQVLRLVVEVGLEGSSSLLIHSVRGRFKCVMREGGEVGAGEVGVESALVYSGEDIVMCLMVMGVMGVDMLFITSNTYMALGFCRWKFSISCLALM
jgi:hypothetical protein